MKFTLLTFFLFWVSFHFVSGQEVKFYPPNGDVSQNSITSIVQDNQGFLWFGTKYGLNQYDGTGFKYFFHDKKKEIGLKNNSIERIIKDSEGNLWIGHSADGISCFNPETQNFIKLNPILKNGFGNSTISALFEDLDGDIWIGTEEKGLKIWNKKTQTLEHFFIEKNIEVVSFLTSENLEKAIAESEIVISRSGYTTLMDLVFLEKKAILIPTPGQTEQEYLAKHFYEQKIFFTQTQKELNLKQALVEIKHFKGFEKNKFQKDTFQEYVIDLLNHSSR